MPMIGFNYTELLVKRDKPLSKDLKIENSLGIIKVEDHKLPLAGSESSVVKVDFEFAIDYSPEIGKIAIKGDVLYSAEDKKIKEINDVWKKEKRIPDDIMILVVNTIMSRCNIKALSMSQEVNLPAHIRMPIVGPAPNQPLKKESGKTKAK